MEGFGWMSCSFSPPISASELLRLDRYCFLHTPTHPHTHTRTRTQRIPLLFCWLRSCAGNELRLSSKRNVVHQV